MTSQEAGRVLGVVGKRQMRAHAAYGRWYDNALYCAARTGDVGQNNLLLDEAMALCGHPMYRIRDRERTTAEYQFLAAFLPAR